MPDKRIAHLQDLYSLLSQLETALGERGRLLIAVVVLDGHNVEFTFYRTVERIGQDTGSGPRVVRIGAHALISASTHEALAGLSQHRDQMRGGSGNDRGSIFRLIVLG